MNKKQSSVKKRAIPHSKPYIGPEEPRAVARVIRSGQLAMGREVSCLEQRLSTAAGQKYGTAVTSGTSALYLALMALEAGRGDGVIIPSYVCTALLNAIRMAGAAPILADVDPVTGNMTADTVKKVMRKSVKAVIVPHLFGLPGDVPAIKRLGVPVIEDCAQCVGTEFQKKPVGSMGDLSVFSFYATKVLAAGEGGMVCTSKKKLADKIRDYREYDNRMDDHPRFNFKMTDFQAALANCQLKKLREMVRKRRKIASIYTDQLKGTLLGLPAADVIAKSIYFRYVVRMRSGSGKFIRAMSDAGVHCARPIFRPLHHYFGLKGFPGTEEIYKTAVSIPVYPGLSERDARKIAGLVRKISGS